MDTLNLAALERVDLPDLQYAVGTSQLGFQQAVTTSVLTPQTNPMWVLNGFASSMPTSTSVQVTLGAAILAYRVGANVSYGVMTCNGNPTQTIDVTNYTPNTYGIYIAFTYVPNAVQERTFWNPYNGGYEYAASQATRMQANWQIRIEVTSPGAEWLQVGSVTLPSGTLVDQRPFYFEGRPDQNYVQTWGTGTNDRNANRSAYGISDLRTFADAMKTCLEDIKGPGLCRWYTNYIGGQTIGYAGTAVASRTSWTDANFYVQGDSNAPAIQFGGTGGALKYNRTTNIATLTAGGVDKLFVSNIGVGIAVATPQNKLDVGGNAALGSYAGTSAPTNGLIVSGPVGVGTSTPGAYQFAVAGTSNFVGNQSVTGNMSATGSVTAATATISGASTLNSLTVTNALAAGSGSVSGTFSVTGATTLGTVSLNTINTAFTATSLASLNGNLTTPTGTFTSSLVSSVSSSLAAASATSLTVSGGTTSLAATTISGSLGAQAITATTLAATGNVSTSGGSYTTNIVGSVTSPVFSCVNSGNTSGLYFDGFGNFFFALAGYTKIQTNSTGGTGGLEGVIINSKLSAGNSIFKLIAQSSTTPITALNVDGSGDLTVAAYMNSAYITCTNSATAASFAATGAVSGATVTGSTSVSAPTVTGSTSVVSGAGFKAIISHFCLNNAVGAPTGNSGAQSGNFNSPNTDIICVFMPFSGSIVGLAFGGQSTTTVTAQIYAEKNGALISSPSACALSGSITSGLTSYSTTFAKGTFPFAAGNYLSLTWNTSVASSTIRLQASIVVEFTA